MKSLTNWLCLLAALWVPAVVDARPAFPEGEILLRHSEGPRATEIRLTKSATTLRVDQLGESRPPAPANLIDLASGDITIIAPVNQSVRTIPAAAFDPPKPAGPGAAPEFPPGIGAKPAPPGTPATPEAPPATNPPGANQPGIPTAPPGGIPGPPGTPPRIGPDPALLPPGTEIPPMPERPNIPGGTPGSNQPGIPARPGGIPGGIPGGLPGGMPPMAGFPDMRQATGELVGHEETRDIHGFPCRRHTLLLDRSRELTLWLASHPDLPPFHLLRWDEPPRFGPRDPMQEWPGILRKGGHFPMLVELREAPRPVRRTPPAPLAPHDKARAPEPEPERRVIATWEVVSITPGTPDPALFGIPQGYSRIAR